MMANPAFTQAAPCSPEALTAVELTWLEKRVEHWIRFGRDVSETIIDRRRRVLSFAPNTIFAFVRWASNDFGTIVSRNRLGPRWSVLRKTGPRSRRSPMGCSSPCRPGSGRNEPARR